MVKKEFPRKWWKGFMLHEGILHPLPEDRKFGRSPYDTVNILDFKTTKGAILSFNKILSCGFNASRAVIMMSRIGMAVEKRNLSKIPNARHYMLKTCAKCKKNYQTQ